MLSVPFIAAYFWGAALFSYELHADLAKYQECLGKYRDQVYVNCLNRLGVDYGAEPGADVITRCQGEQLAGAATNAAHSSCVAHLEEPVAKEDEEPPSIEDQHTLCQKAGRIWDTFQDECGGGTPVPEKAVRCKTSERYDEKTKRCVAKDSSAPQRRENPQGLEPADTKLADSSEITRDLNACRETQDEANTCCNNPIQCGAQLSSADQQRINRVNQLVRQGPQPNQSINEYCSQLQSLGNDSARINSGFAGVCTLRQNSCVTSCNNTLGKYARLLEECNSNGCSQKADLQAAVNSARQISNSCGGLRANAQMMASNSTSTGVNNAYARYCTQSTGAGGPPTPGMDYQANPLSFADQNYDCSVNPNSDACAENAQIEKRENGGFGFAKPEKPQSGDFNVKDIPDQEQPFMGLDPNGSGPQISVNTVANNSGTQLPNSGDSIGKQLGENKQFNDPKSYTTDIEKGYRSGGFSNGSSGYQNGLDFNNKQNRGMERNQVAANQRSPSGLDLKQFLPGGKNDPKHVGGYGLQSSQIRSKEDDIWEVVSNKFIEKCKLAVLWNCQPSESP